MDNIPIITVISGRAEWATKMKAGYKMTTNEHSACQHCQFGYQGNYQRSFMSIKSGQVKLSPILRTTDMNFYCHLNRGVGDNYAHVQKNHTCNAWRKNEKE